MEEVAGPVYRRSARVGGAAVIVEMEPRPQAEAVQLSVTGEAGDSLAALVQGGRRLFDLDADPAAISSHLEADATIGPLIQSTPE